MNATVVGLDEYDVDYVGTWRPDPVAERLEFVRMLDRYAHDDLDRASIEWLHSDEMFPVLRETLRAMTTDIQQRLKTMSRTHQDRRRVVQKHRAYADALALVNSISRDRARYRTLIQAHKYALIRCGDEPRPYDLILWQVLDIRA